MPLYMPIYVLDMLCISLGNDQYDHDISEVIHYIIIRVV